MYSSFVITITSLSSVTGRPTYSPIYLHGAISVNTVRCSAVSHDVEFYNFSSVLYVDFDGRDIWYPSHAAESAEVDKPKPNDVNIAYVNPTTDIFDAW